MFGSINILKRKLKKAIYILKKDEYIIKRQEKERIQWIGSNYGGFGICSSAIGIIWDILS